MVASTALAASRQEREEVQVFVEDHARPPSAGGRGRARPSCSGAARLTRRVPGATGTPRRPGDLSHAMRFGGTPLGHTPRMTTAATPLPVSPSADDGLALRYYDVTSTDGTRLRAWTNDVDGPTVLLCNGLGTNPFAWPALLDPDCGVRVISWNHRGTGGSERPADPEDVGVEPFVDDAIAVLDDAGVDACVLMGWSIGVNTMFETAVEHPDRVTGLFAVGGVPGDTFASMGAPMLIPRPFRKPIAVNTGANVEAGRQATARRSATGCRSDRSPTRCSRTPGS